MGVLSIVLIACLVACSGAASDPDSRPQRPDGGDMMPGVDMEITSGDTPLEDEVIELTIRMNPREDVPNATLTAVLPAGVEFAGEILSWEGDLQTGEALEIQTRLKISRWPLSEPVRFTLSNNVSSYWIDWPVEEMGILPQPSATNGEPDTSEFLGAEPMPSVAVSLVAEPGDPAAGQVTRLEVSMIAVSDFSGAVGVFDLPAGFRLAPGSELLWTGDLSRGQEQIVEVSGTAVQPLEGEARFTLDLQNGEVFFAAHHFGPEKEVQPGYRPEGLEATGDGQPPEGIEVELPVPAEAQSSAALLPPVDITVVERSHSDEDMSFTIFATFNQDVSNSQLNVIMPDSFTLVGGPLAWQGNASKDEVIALEVTIRRVEKISTVLEVHFSSDQGGIDPYIYHLGVAQEKEAAGNGYEEPTGTINASGRFIYYEDLSVIRGAYFAVVEVYDSDPDADDFVCSAYTDGDGYWSCSGSAADGAFDNTVEIYARLRAYNYNVGGVQTSGGAEYRFETPQQAVDENATVDVDFGSWSPGWNSGGGYWEDGAWHILKMGVLGNAFTTYVGGETPPIYNEDHFATFVWPDTDSDNSSEYWNWTVYVEGPGSAEPDTWDESPIIHEYGHYLMDHFAVLGSVDYCHDPGEIFPNCGHSWNSHEDPATAYIEGWPNYFQGATKKYWGLADPHMYIETTWSVDMDASWHPIGTWDDAESTPAGIMWDINDATDDDQNSDGVGDLLTMGHNEIHDTFSNDPGNIFGTPVSIHGFYNSFQSRYAYDEYIIKIYFEHGLNKDIWSPTGSMSINGGDTYATDSLVTLHNSASDYGTGVDEMRYQNSGGSWVGWTDYATRQAWYLPDSDGTRLVYIQYRDHAGNVSSITSDSIILDRSPPVGVISINGGATYATSTSVTLDLSASDATSGMGEMRIGNAGGSWTSWQPYVTSKSWTLPSGDGTKTVYIQYRDNAGNASGSYHDNIILDKTAPTGSISIDGGASYANSTSVTLNLLASDATSGPCQMRFQNAGGTWSSWQSYATTKSWTLPSGDGSKVVYAQFKDCAGWTSSSYNDSIILDTVAPTGSININSGASYATSTSVTLNLSASDGTSDMGQMRIGNAGGSWSSWQEYATGKSWTLASGDGTKTVYVEYKDRAGNVSEKYHDNIILDTAAPSGSISINGGATYATSASVTLSLSASDGSGSGTSQMRFSNSGSSWSTWESYTTSKSWTLSGGEGTKTVYVQYKDNAGNGSGSYSDTIVLDTAAPTGSISINAGDTYANSASVTLNLSASDGSGSGVSQMRFSNDGSSWSGWESYATTKGWTLSGGDGSRSVYVQYKDNAGYPSAPYNDSIIVDSVAPSGSVVINAGSIYADSTAVTLDLSASDGSGSGLDKMRFSNDGSSWSGWSNYATSDSWTLSGGDGAKSVYAQFSDNAGNVSTSAYDTIILDTSGPSGDITINDGGAYANSPNVTLHLLATDAGSGVNEMRFSNDFSTWSGWESYSTTKSWTLTSGDEIKTVYVQFVDYIGNLSGGFSAEVTLDTAAPSGSITINGGDTYVNTQGVTLDLSASDSSSGVSLMRFSNDGVSWSAWEPYDSGFGWILSSGDGAKSVYVQFRDAAGNVSGSNSDSIILDTAAPAGTIAVNSGDPFATSTAVTLDLSAGDTASGVDEMRFSNTGTSWSSWESYATSKSWTLESGDGSKGVYVEYKDGAGNVSESFMDTIILDTTAPAGSISVNNGDTYANSPYVTLNLTANDAGSGVAEMRFSYDESSWSSWVPYATSMNWTLTSGDGGNTVYVQYKDNAGRESTSYGDDIILDTTDPTGSITIESGAAYVSGTTVNLTLSSADSGSGVAEMSFSNTGDSWTSWEAYSTGKSWTLTASDGQKWVYVKYRDAAGNMSGVFQDDIILDTSGPTGSISIDDGASATNVVSVSLVISATDPGSGVDVMSLSADGAAWSAWEVFSTSKEWFVSGGDGSKSVYVKFRDNLGQLSAIYQDTIILDTVPPDSTATSPATAPGLSFTVSWSGSDALSGIAGFDVQYRVGSDGSWEDWLTGTAATSATFGPFDPVTVEGDQTFYFRVRAIDEAGNVESYPAAPDGDTGTFVEGMDFTYLPMIWIY